MRITIEGREVGEGQPCYVVAEIGQNHNGDLETALQMVRAAEEAGADAVKFQKRTVDLCVPAAQRDQPRALPDGRVVPYLDYRRFLEFGRAEFDAIDAECRRIGITWFASAWDLPSLEFLLAYDPPALKVPSACLTDHALLATMARTGRPVLLSTGMSTSVQIDQAVDCVLDQTASPLVVLHCTSTYPCRVEDLNLLCIQSLQALYGDEAVIGYSGHEVGVSTTIGAVGLGAAVVERHFTLNRASFGTDQAASLEPAGLARLVRDIRKWERARGDGIKRVYDSELPVMARLRRTQEETTR